MKDAQMRNCSFRCKLATMMTLGIGVVVAGFLILRSQEVYAKAPLGKSWPAAQRVAMDRIDHSPWDALLKKYVDNDGYVNYQAWRKSASDRRALQSYLASLGRADARKRTSRNAQLAFWINAYNAVTIEGILQVYPTSSIRNHTAKLAGYNIWKDLPLRVADGAYSLHQMEHDILRETGDPRIHFAIVCASVSCPRLLNEAYTPDKVDKQLDANARDFFSRSQNLQVDSRRGTLHMSTILDWFAKDFGMTQAERLAYIKPFLPKAAQPLASDSRTKIKYLDYNWNLNDQTRKPRSASRR